MCCCRVDWASSRLIEESRLKQYLLCLCALSNIITRRSLVYLPVYANRIRSLNEIYEQKREQHTAEVQRREEEMRQAFFSRVCDFASSKSATVQSRHVLLFAMSPISCSNVSHVFHNVAM